MTSLKSRGYVKENFSWMWYYWFLTNEGIEYLRDYLHLPEGIIPATLKKAAPARPARPAGGARDRFGGDRGDDRRRFGGNRDGGYRREGGFGGASRDGGF